MDKKQIIAYLNFLRDDLTNKDEIIDYCINEIKKDIETENKQNEVINLLTGLVVDISNLLSENNIEWQQAGYYTESKKWLLENKSYHKC